MDRTTITICKINIELNRLLKVDVPASELEKLEKTVIKMINEITHTRTHKITINSDTKSGYCNKTNKDNAEEKHKRKRWNCNSCVNSCNKNKTKTVCELCKSVSELGNGENHYYNKNIGIMDNCSKCKYLINKDGNYYCGANYYDSNENRVIHPSVRKNYLLKNVPKFCILKEIL